MRDQGSIPRLGRSPGEGNSYRLQYSGLENSMEHRVHGVPKSWRRLSDFPFTRASSVIWRPVLWAPFSAQTSKHLPLPRAGARALEGESRHQSPVVSQAPRLPACLPAPWLPFLKLIPSSLDLDHVGPFNTALYNALCSY